MSAGRAEVVENRVFSDLKLGESASLKRVIAQADLDLFAVAVADPMLGQGEPTAAGRLLGVGLVTRLILGRLPGPGGEIRALDLALTRTPRAGDEVTARIEIARMHAESSEIELICRCEDAAGEAFIVGTARVLAPDRHMSVPLREATEVRFARHERFRALMAEARDNGPLATAIAHPCDAESLGAAVEAARAGLITPILVGPSGKILRAAQAAGLDIAAYRIVDAPHSEAAAARAVELVCRHEAAMLMKGSLHTDELLHAVLRPETGLQTGRRLSHVYLMDVPAYPRPILLTDAAVNIAPDLKQKRDILQNAIDMAIAIGIERPRVAILAAVETVNPEMRSTLEAAALCKMADRGQIRGALIDGPLAFDNAVSPEAARTKGIVSDVAGRADILMAPDLEAGNMLAKQLTFMAGADAAGVVLGARVPIILTSRADVERTRLASCAVAARLARAAGTLA